jgi:zinc protease
MIMLKRFIVLMLAGVLVLPLSAQKKAKKEKNAPAPVAEAPVARKPAEPVMVTSVEGITEYRLENGMRVLLFPDPSKQTVTVNVTYLVGSKHENYGETGMAHLLEHLVFKGTPKYPFNIMKELEDRGADFNGTTWLDRTNYFETLSASDENLRWALEMEADRMVNSFIAQKDLDSEMTVVRNEFESGENSPVRVLMQRIMAGAYEWHNYGKSTIGSRADIENVPIDRLQAFYRMYYQPDNAVLILAGKFDSAKTIGWVNETFGAIPRPERALPVFYTRDPVQDGERTVTVRRVGDIQWMGMGHKISSGTHPDYAPISVVNEILGNSPSGRLYKNLVETKMATSVFNFGFQTKEPGFSMAFAQVPKDKSLEDARKAMAKTFDELTSKPITQEELDRAKTSILKQIELNLNNASRIGVAMSDFVAMGDWRLYFLYRDQVEAVTLDEVNRVAKHYFKPDNRTTGLFVPTEKPDRAEIPEDPSVEELVKNYKGKEAVASGEEFDPSPKNIEARTERGTLANGMKVAYLPKKTRGESVQVRMTMRFGDEKNLIGKGSDGQFAGRMLNRGTATMTRQQIQDEFDRLKARVNIFGGATSVSVFIETTRPNLPEVLKLVDDILKNANFPSDEFEKMKAEAIAGIESNRSEPQAIASTTLSKHLSPYPKGDPRYAESFDESIEAIKAVKLENVKKFHKDFYGANNGTLAVVGDFDTKEIDGLVRQYWGNWNSKAGYKRLEAKIKEVAPIDQRIETPDKANAFFLAQFNWVYSDNEADYPALVLGHYILGGGTASRLFSRIRGQEGISYGVGSGFSAGNLDKVGTFNAYAIYAPENVGRLEETFKEEIMKVVTEGFTAEEIQNAKTGWMQSRIVGRAQDASVAGSLNNYLFTGRDFAWDEELEKKVMALTVEEVNAAMKKHLDYNKLNMVKAGDFNKSK